MTAPDDCVLHIVTTPNARFEVAVNLYDRIVSIDAEGISDLAAFRRNVIGKPFTAWRARIKAKCATTVRFPARSQGVRA